MKPREPTVASTECQSSNPGVRDPAHRRGQAVLLRLPIEVSDPSAAGNLCRFVLRVYADVVQGDRSMTKPPLHME